MKKNNTTKPSKKISVQQSMDDVTKDKIILVDTKGNTLGEVERAPKIEPASEQKSKTKKTKKNSKKKSSKENKKSQPKNPEQIRQQNQQKQYGQLKQEERPNHIKRRRLSLKERRKRKRRAIAAIIAEWVLGLAILIIGGVLFSFFFCKMQNVVVEGSTIYTDAEIKEYVLDGKYSDNCVYNVVHNIFHPKKDIPFIQSAKVTMSGLNTTKITITQRIPIAYAIEGGTYEANTTNNQAKEDGSANGQEGSDNPEGTEVTFDPDREGDAAANYDLSVEEAQSTNVREPLSNDAVIKTGSAVIKYFDEDGKITDISDIILPNSTRWTDIEPSGEKVGDIIVDDSVVLDSALVTLKSLKANNVFLNTIRVDKSHNIFGSKDEVKINFGLKNDMDEKCKRLSIILPQLENQRGTLHLENFGPENTDIVFKKEM